MKDVDNAVIYCRCKGQLNSSLKIFKTYSVEFWMELLQGSQDLENQSEDEFEYEIEDIMENLFHNPLNHNQSEHGGIIEQLLRGSSLNNRGAGDFSD